MSGFTPSSVNSAFVIRRRWINRLAHRAAIELRESGSGRLRFIEAKGRAQSAETVPVTRNEILTGLDAPHAFILATVEVVDGVPVPPLYVRQPFAREPDFGAKSVTCNLADRLARAEVPS